MKLFFRLFSPPQLTNRGRDARFAESSPLKSDGQLRKCRSDWWERKLALIFVETHTYTQRHAYGGLKIIYFATRLKRRDASRLSLTRFYGSAQNRAPLYIFEIVATANLGCQADTSGENRPALYLFDCATTFVFASLRKLDRSLRNTCESRVFSLFFWKKKNKKSIP